MQLFKTIQLLTNSIIICAPLFICQVSANTPETDYRTKPVPPPATSATALDYHSVPFSPADGLSGEPLVPLKSEGIAGESFYARKDSLNAPYYRAFPSAPPRCLLRRSIVQKLKRVNERLGAYGIEIYVLDGFRPVACQRQLWNYFLEQAKARMPQAPRAKLRKYAGRYCSDPGRYDASDSSTWPTHLTGAAVDLTLREKKSGQLMYMGSIFDDASPVSHTNHFEKKLEDTLSQSDYEARKNRRLLYWAMTSEGFANYPYEWWHYDWGNQMWIKNSGQTAGKAWYGPAGQTEPR